MSISDTKYQMKCLAKSVAWPPLAALRSAGRGIAVPEEPSALAKGAVLGRSKPISMGAISYVVRGQSPVFWLAACARGKERGSEPCCGWRAVKSVARIVGWSRNSTIIGWSRNSAACSMGFAETVNSVISRSGDNQQHVSR